MKIVFFSSSRLFSVFMFSSLPRAFSELFIAEQSKSHSRLAGRIENWICSVLLMLRRFSFFTFSLSSPLSAPTSKPSCVQREWKTNWKWEQTQWQRGADEKCLWLYIISGDYNQRIFSDNWTDNVRSQIIAKGPIFLKSLSHFSFRLVLSFSLSLMRIFPAFIMCVYTNAYNANIAQCQKQIVAWWKICVIV